MLKFELKKFDIFIEFSLHLSLFKKHLARIDVIIKVLLGVIVLACCVNKYYTYSSFLYYLTLQLQ